MFVNFSYHLGTYTVLLLFICFGYITKQEIMLMRSTSEHKEKIDPNIYIYIYIQLECDNNNIYVENNKSSGIHLKYIKHIISLSILACVKVDQQCLKCHASVYHKPHKCQPFAFGQVHNLHKKNDYIKS